MKATIGLMLLIGGTSIALAQTAEDHSVHHPDQKANIPAAEQPADKSSLMQAKQNMEHMQALMAKLHETKDPAERKRLLAEHQAAMHKQMDMMHSMMGKGMMSKGGGKEAGGMNMMMDMQSRMDMMQMMMEQMMMQHDEAGAH